MTEHDERVNDRFRVLEDRVQELRMELRVFAPHSVQLGVLEATVDDIELDIAELKVAGQARDERVRVVEDQVRRGPVEMLKLILIVVTVFASGAAGIIAVAGFVR